MPGTSERICRACGWYGPASDLLTGHRVELGSGKFHLRGNCPECRAFVAWIAHEPPTLHVGKYKGRTIESVWRDDPSYLRWLRDRPDLKPALRETLDAVMQAQP